MYLIVSLFMLDKDLLARMWIRWVYVARVAAWRIQLCKILHGSTHVKYSTTTTTTTTVCV